MLARQRLPVILAIGLFISAYFVATQPITPAMVIVSSLSVIGFALPSYWAVVKTKGRERGLVILAVLGAYALLVESSAIATGFPYGNFVYTDVLGNKVFGLTPWTVAFAYPPILLLAFTLAVRLGRFGAAGWRRTMTIAALTAGLATACDVVLDPAAVSLGFWYWDAPGWYYGVPLVNFAGWLLSGFVGAILLQLAWGKGSVPPAVAYSGLAILFFWTSVNLWLGQWLPVLTGAVLSCWFYAVLVRHGKPGYVDEE